MASTTNDATVPPTPTPVPEEFYSVFIRHEARRLGVSTEALYDVLAAAAKRDEVLWDHLHHCIDPLSAAEVRRLLLVDHGWSDGGMVDPMTTDTSHEGAPQDPDGHAGDSDTPQARAGGAVGAPEALPGPEAR